jgi:methionyl-tRNA formyltransferase
MRIALMCATRRGLRVLEKLIALKPDAELVVFSFRETEHEPPYLDDIRSLALAHGAEFHETRQVGAAKWDAFWNATPVDLILCVSWRYLIPKEIYRRARLGCYVFHDSPLPCYRGFAPTVWAILNGERETGVTLFEIAEGVDSGPIIAQERIPIGDHDTIAEVIERVTQSYLRLLEDHLPNLLAGRAPRTPQDERQATYTCKRLPEDNQIAWSASTAEIYNLIRAVTAPYPGAFTTLQGVRLTIWSAQRIDGFPRYAGRIPGRIVEVREGEGVVVLTGDGALLIRRVQLGQDPPADAWTILNSLSMTLGR